MVVIWTEVKLVVLWGSWAVFAPELHGADQIPA